MTKAELENKHLAELHALAAESGVERYRLLTRAELIERLAGAEAGGSGGGRAASGANGSRGERGSGAEDEGSRERPRRRRRRRSGAAESGSAAAGGDAEDRDEGAEAEPTGRAEAKSEDDRGSAGSEGNRGRGEAESDDAAEESASRPEPAAGAAAESARPRRRRRRRFGRRGKQGLTLPGLLLPPEAGRQTVLCAETREACTLLLRSVAAELAAASKGPDPVALLIDPSPEELADWKRDAPQAEIVAAGQPRHADDALAQAAARAAGGEDVILLVDSLNRLAEAYSDPDAAKDFFDAGRSKAANGSGTLTVVAALERPA